MIFIAEENRYRIDLHGYTKSEAEIEMQNILDTLPIKYEAIYVIHGYSGVKLLEYIRKELKHPRILKIYNKYNPGTSLIVLNKDFRVDLQKKKRITKSQRKRKKQMKLRRKNVD